MRKLLIVGAAGLVAAMGFATIAAAVEPKQTMPKGWNYELKGQQRVPKANRQMNPDGSWREEIRQGKCVTLREKSADGVYRQKTRCSR